MTKKYVRCPWCEAVNLHHPDREIHCRRCGSRIHEELHIAFQKSLAYLITAMILYLPANLMPMLVTEQFGHPQPSTLLGGVITLWEHGSWPIALIIFFASIFIPILKFILLLYLLLGARWHLYSREEDKQRLFFITEIIGPWSMIDVFVVAILAALIQMHNIQIIPGAAATAFALMVFFTLLAAQSFDTRLIWRNEEEADGTEDS
ncbi:MAG: paraquat-inducible membrane protein A [Campylobacteraceae bacterium 4484_4]|nr:MAG: paraquat-inducible membrane protein A [Campylobacteraceae bacterium 4484_4]